MAPRTKGRAAPIRQPRIPSKASESGSPIIYIHGLGPHPAPDELKLEWDLALFGRSLGPRSRMAYWADILHKDEYVLKGARSRPTREESSRAMRRGSSPAPEPTPDRAEILREAGLASYFLKKGVRERIQQRLLEVLPAPGQPFTLVAHSQGMIVALEVLASMRPAPEVEEFVTLGSPLAHREIQAGLNCLPLRVPAGVAKWHNFIDPLDPLTLDQGLRGDFRGGETISDEIIHNPRSRALIGFNPQSAAGYLAHPKVRSLVQMVLHIDSRAPFLVARDVAALMVAESRHSVLIEILEPKYSAIDESPEETRAHEATVEKGETALSVRIKRAAGALRKEVPAPEARIDELRRYVAARLTPSEIRQVAARHRELRVYTIWRSASKRKLLTRSGRVLQADAAFEAYAADGRGISWAVLDTGVRSDHPHFHDMGTETIKAIWDCTKPGPPRRLEEDLDKDGHGSHVSGIIAGRTATHRAIAPAAHLVVYKVLDEKGEGEDAWIIKAMDHIAAQNEGKSTLAIHGLNLSLGGPYDSTVYGCGFSPVCAELRRLWRDGVLVVVASGNEGQLDVQTADGEVEINSPMSIGDPANLEDCVAVGSVNADHPHLYGISSFSSRGPTSDGRCKPDVVAPGERISSCNARYRRKGRQLLHLYRLESGTSMAAPHVSGLLAAFLSARPEFRGRPDEVKRVLLETCTDLGRDRYHQGRGLPNLMKMLLSV
jgi:subtilisin family serine protease